MTLGFPAIAQVKVIEMRRLILHVGNPKTGTTSLQQFFFDNRAALLERGVLYPVSESRPRHSHSNMVWEYTNQKNFDPAGITFEAVETAARSCEWDTLLISSEFFLQSREFSEIFAAIKSLMTKLDLGLTVVAFVRPQHAWVNSAYCQITKMFLNHLSFSEFVKRTAGQPRYDYGESMKPWMEWPGAKFIARPFSAKHLRPDLETSFFASIGLQERLGSALQLSRTQVKNASPDQFTIEISRRLSASVRSGLKLSAKTRRKLQVIIEKTSQRRGWKSKPFNGVTTHLREQINDRYDSSNDEFARKVWGQRWNLVFEEDYSRDLVVNDLLQTGMSKSVEVAIAAIVDRAVAMSGSSSESMAQIDHSEIAVPISLRREAVMKKMTTG